MVDQSALRNRLLSRMSASDFSLLAGELTFLNFGRGTILREADEPFEAAYFPEDGLISIVGQSPVGQVAEVGVIGREGFVYPSLVLGANTIPFKVQVQIAGDVHRLPIRDLLRATERSPTLRHALLLFAHVNTVQASYSVLSNAVHSIDKRLARWLLMCHDRSPSDDMALTHQFVGVMLAVRRPSVTKSMHVLEGMNMIETYRGCITITNRAALEAFAGDAYGRPEAEYRRLIGSL